MAALLVVACQSLPRAYDSGVGGRQFAPAAAMGVDLFFLNSGFIRALAARNNDASRRRWA